MAHAAIGLGSGGLDGFTPALTRFVGRAAEADEIVALLGQDRLVTLTGPGGVGKTRLAVEVARRVADEFDDGVCLVELAAVQEPALVSAAAAAALGVSQVPEVPVADSLAAVLARRQILLVLDNCEHVAEAAAALCGTVLSVADEVRILATSREPVGVAGEARYRVPPLQLPHRDDPAAVGESEAVILFADRARQVDPHFSLNTETGFMVAQLVRRLDGIPLAIELAAARVEALGVAQLLERLDDRFRLLTGPDRLAAPRHRSLAAMVGWSYELLSEHERDVFRRLSVFPGPFSLEAAQAVAGPGADEVVLSLVDCSLVAPPRTDSDGRVRYPMLETLRAYGITRLSDTGEQHRAAAALAGYALGVAERAAAGLQTSAGELAAAQWLDAEDAAVHQALTWALENHPPTAVRLAIALAGWWRLRGRAVAGYASLSTAAKHTATGDDAWCAAHLWLGQLALRTWDLPAALGHFTVVGDVASDRTPSAALVDGLVGRSGALRNLERITEAVEDARHALAVALEIGYPAGEALALVELGASAFYVGDLENALSCGRQARVIDPASLPGWVARRRGDFLSMVLVEAGDVAAAQRSCADGLARARRAGDLHSQAHCLALIVNLDLRTGHIAEAEARLREAIELASRIGDQLRLMNCVQFCGYLCVATGRWAEAITMWSAYAACQRGLGTFDLPQDAHRRQEPLRKARQALGADRVRAAEERGAAMTLETAVEFAGLLASTDPPGFVPAPGLPQLSARERELVILVARGLTDAQIAGRLYISVRTVGSHLDRIRDKTGCRRRADLTRLALQASLV